MIRILIAAGIRLYREGLGLVLLDVDEMEVVGTVSRMGEVEGAVQRHRPDILLIDLAMMNVTPCMRDLAGLHDGVKVVAITVPETEDEILSCLESGVSAFVTRDGSLHDLIQAIRDADSGELCCSPKLAGTLLRRLAETAGSPTTSASEDARLSTLTPREIGVLDLIGRGLCNKDIGRELHIGVPTVKNHVHNILSKLGVRSRAEAAALMRAQPSPPASVFG